MRAIGQGQAGLGRVVRLGDKHRLCGSVFTGGRFATPTSAYCPFPRRCLLTYSSVGVAVQESAVPIVTIKVPYRVQFGEVLRVVGSSSVLGEWSAERALDLTWTDGDVWTAQVPIAAGDYEFKCVVYNETTKTVTRWEDGDNRVLHITPEAGAWDVNCTWGATADMAQTFTPTPALSALDPAAPAPVPEPEAAHASATEVEGPAEEASGSVAEPVAAAVVVEEQMPAPVVMPEVAEGSKPAPKVPTETATVAASPPEPAAAVLSPAAAVPTAVPTADISPAADATSTDGGAAMLLLATCAAGTVAAFALLNPSGLNTAALGDRASQALGSTMLQSSVSGAQVRAQLQSQLAALTGHVSDVQASAAAPMVRAKVAALADRVSSQISEVTPAVQAQVAALADRLSDARSQVAAVTPAVQAQIAALAGRVSAQVSEVTPVVRAQIASVQGSVTEGLSSLQPMVRNGVAYVQEQASALRDKSPL